jgi:uncharacterized protein YceH (UPF0502 family)
VCLLLLRGPQTVAELRARAERIHAFEDNAAVQAALERLAGRDEALTQVLPRQPGAREVRWVHLLSGPVSVEAMTAAPANVGTPQNALVERVDELEERVRVLEERVEQLLAVSS